MSYRWSGQCPTQTQMNDDCHAAYNHASNGITLCPDAVQMVEILKIAYEW